jgi:predicted DNA-binding protein YlxM (UPF0122 family)
MSKQNKKLSKELILKIQEYYDSGYSCQQTADKFNIGKTTVRSYVNVRPKTFLSEKERKRKAVIAVSKRRRKIKQMAVEYKGGKCVKCGYNKYIGALEFHHLDPTVKDFTISNSGHCRSWEKVKDELDKCILVCSNCHAEIHAEMIEE